MTEPLIETFPDPEPMLEAPAMIFYAVPEMLLVDITRYLFSQPYGQVNHLVDAIQECEALRDSGSA